MRGVVNNCKILLWYLMKVTSHEKSTSLPSVEATLVLSKGNQMSYAYPQYENSL